MLHALLTELTSASTRDVACIAILCIAFYIASLTIYRLFRSPISHFPGPKLAALTWAYEFYYDWILPGKYYARVEQMHKKYDIAVHARSHDEHRRNYVPLKAFFSRASITRLEGRTVERLHRLDKRLYEWVDSGELVNLTHAIYSYVTDIISSMLFEEPSDYLSDPTFNNAWFDKLKHGMVNVPLFSFLPWLPRLMSLPFMRLLYDKEGKWAVFDERTQRQQMTRVKRPTNPEPSRSGKTLFDEIVKGNPSKVSFCSDLTREVAQSVQQAAGHNLNRTLEAIIALLAMDEERQNILRESLRPIFVQTSRPTWVDLEKIRYLSACVTEGIRLIGGNLRRAARISPDQDIIYKGWKIPKKTPVGMTIYWMLMDPDVFPNPKSFLPERWLESSEAQLAKMNKFFVAFSKGSRACIGNHLTYMILYHTIAWLFRPGAPRIHLYETDESHILSSYGLFFGLARVDTPGIRAYLTTSTDR